MLKEMIFKEAASDQLIVGDTAKHPRGGVMDPIFHVGWLRQEYDTISTRKQDPYILSDENKRILQEEVFPYWVKSKLWCKLLILHNCLSCVE